MNDKNTDMNFYIKKLENYIQKLHYSLFNHKDYSIMNLWIIDFLYSNEQEIFQKDIENEFFINRATASKMLKLMEEKDLIKRVSSSTDKRLKKIILCDKGMKLQKVAKEIRIEVENKLTENLTEEETKTFKEICIKILS